MHTAEALTHPQPLAQLMKQTKDNTQAIEVLFQVEALERTNLDGRIVQASKLDIGRIWGDDAVTVPPATAPETTSNGTRQSTR